MSGSAPFAQALAKRRSVHYKHDFEQAAHHIASLDPQQQLNSGAGEFLANITPKMVADWEADQYLPRKHHHAALAQYLGVTESGVAHIIERSRKKLYAKPRRRNTGNPNLTTLFGYLIRKERKNRQWAQSKVAGDLKKVFHGFDMDPPRSLNDARISAWERGKDVPLPQEWHALTKLFGHNPLEHDERGHVLVSIHTGEPTPHQAPPEPPPLPAPAAPADNEAQSAAQPALGEEQPQSQLSPRQRRVHARLIQALPPTDVPPENLKLWGEYVYYLACIS